MSARWSGVCKEIERERAQVTGGGEEGGGKRGRTGRERKKERENGAKGQHIKDKWSMMT